MPLGTLRPQPALLSINLNGGLGDFGEMAEAIVRGELGDVGNARTGTWTTQALRCPRAGPMARRGTPGATTSSARRTPTSRGGLPQGGVCKTSRRSHAGLWASANQHGQRRGLATLQTQAPGATRTRRGRTERLGSTIPSCVSNRLRTVSPKLDGSLRRNNTDNFWLTGPQAVEVGFLDATQIADNARGAYRGHGQVHVRKVARWRVAAVVADEQGQQGGARPPPGVNSPTQAAPAVRPRPAAACTR